MDRLIEVFLHRTEAKKRGLQYVQGSWRNKPYLRKRPRTCDNPTLNMLRHRLKFAKLNSEKTYGTKGLAPTGFPISAQIVKNELKDQRIERSTSVDTVPEEKAKARLTDLQRRQLVAAIREVLG